MLVHEQRFFRNDLIPGESKAVEHLAAQGAYEKAALPLGKQIARIKGQAGRGDHRVPIIGRYALTEGDECLDMQILVEPRQDEMMELPINVMIVDARGDSARVMIADGRATFH
jgi:hypothetical protein